jgi:hypothetical protein
VPGFAATSEGGEFTTFTSENSFDPYGEVLPADPTFYSYSGSLTAPPCTEEVHWVVMAQPVSVSSSQMQKVRTYLSSANDDKSNIKSDSEPPSPVPNQYRNDRPTQALNGRVVTIEYGAAEEVAEHAAAEHVEHEETFWYSALLKPVG